MRQLRPVLTFIREAFIKAFTPGFVPCPPWTSATLLTAARSEHSTSPRSFSWSRSRRSEEGAGLHRQEEEGAGTG